MLIILETGHTEAARNLHARMAQDRLELDDATGQFSRSRLLHMRLPRIQHVGQLMDIRRVLTENTARDLIDNMDEQSIRTYLADRQNADPT